jgi:Helix-turn-helix domain
MSGGGSDPHGGSKIGRTLELARKERGLSFEQVQEATKIRAGYLKELERENFDVLPAVYVQGSLKTYANFLQLDGEALVRQLKRRQASKREPEYVVGPRKDASELPTVPLGAAAVVDNREITEDEEDAGWTSSLMGINRYLYLGVGAFLVLVAVVLALTLARDRPPAVSQVREPLISQAPPEAAPIENREDNGPEPRRNEENRGAKDEDNGPQHERAAAPPDKGDEGADQSAQTGQDDSPPEEGSRDTAATESAPATAEPEATESETTPPATAEPETTPPATAEPETTPPATAEPETASTPPPAEEPAPRRSPDGPEKKRSGSRDDDDFDVRISAGSDDPVHISGGVPGD